MSVVAGSVAWRIARLHNLCPPCTRASLAHLIIPTKKISTHLKEINEDGPRILKYVLNDTFIGTEASTYTIKERFYDLNLKQFRHNVESLNQFVREKTADLIAAGHPTSDGDMIISLFRAYKTSTNEEFKNSVTFWRNEWNARRITTYEQLMAKADAKYQELRSLGQWGRRQDTNDQFVALNAHIKDRNNKSASKHSENTSSNKNNNSTSNKRNTTTGAWKYDRSMSNSKTYQNKNNGKTYYWCEGQGHSARPMWTLHKPGTCTKESSSNTNKSNSAQSGQNYKQAFVNMLQQKGASEDEIDSKVEAMLAIIDD